MGYPITGTGGAFSIAIDPSDNKPVIARYGIFFNAPTPKMVCLKKWYNGTSWTEVGYLRASDSIESISIAFDPSDNELVVMYSDEAEIMQVKKGSLP